MRSSSSLEIGPIVRSSARRKGVFAMVVLQLAVSFVIVACLLEVGSWLRSIGHSPSGYDQRDLIGVTVRVPRAAAAAPADAPDVMARIAALPGVAAVARLWPMLRAEEGGPTLLRAADDHGDGDDRRAEARGWTTYASPSLAEVLNLELVEGSLAATTPGGGGGAAETRLILTKHLRDAIFPPGQSVVGRLVAADDAPPARVAGVVEDVILRELFWQDPASVSIRLADPPARGETGYLVRARPGAAAAVAAALPAVVGRSGPARLVTITPYGTTPAHFQSVADGLLALFACVGFGVAAIAIVGALAVSSFVVAERRRQIGIRRALGATRRDVFRYFLVESSITAALGTGLGLLLTIGLLLAWRRVFPALPIGWGSLALAAFVLWLNATVAAAIPARAAARISPSLATRGRP